MAPQKHYLVRQPTPLETLAIEALARWISSQAVSLLLPTSQLQQHKPAKSDALITRQIELTRNYLQRNLFWMYHNEVANETIRALLRLQKGLNSQTRYVNMMSHRHTKVIGRMIEALFTSKLTSLTFFSAIQACFFDTVFSKSFMLSSLKSLKLTVNRVSENDLIRLIKELHNLKHLAISDCTHNVIKCIAENCNLLEEIESYHDKNLNETSIDLLIQLPNLKSVTLMYSTLCQKGLEALLLCKTIKTKLTMRVCYQKVECRSELERVLFHKKYAGKPFNLKYYRNSPETTLNQLCLLVRICPLIEELQLDRYYADRISHLVHLAELERLRTLTLTGFHFYDNRIMDFLELKKCNISHLRLDETKEIDLDALICISRTCPNLEMLSISESNFRHLFVAPRLTLQTDSLQFRKLETLSLKKTLSIQTTDEQLYFLLTSCPNIKFIELNMYRFPITDEFMCRVLDRNPMIHLKELRIIFRTDGVVQDQLQPTMLFANRIIQNCTDPEITFIKDVPEDIMALIN